MSRLTVHLPETLHSQLTSLAKNEGVSLNQYIVYALTRQVTLAYDVRAVPQQATAQQQTSFAALLQSLGQASFEEIEAVMAARETVDPEAGLSPEIMSRLQQRIAEKYVKRNLENRN